MDAQRDLSGREAANDITQAPGGFPSISPMPAPGDLQDVLAKLRERYLASSGNTITAFRQLAEQLQATPSAAAVVSSLRRELHRVHGTAGSYGFHEVSRLAGALEPVAVKWEADPALDRDRRSAIVRQFAQALTEAFGAPNGRSATPAAPADRIVLIEVPELVETGLVAEAIHRGYRVELTSATDAEAVFAAAPPTIVIAGTAIGVRVPEGVPLILLRDGGRSMTAVPGARILDAATDPHEILLIAEATASRSGLVGVTLLVVEDDPAMSALLRVVGERQGMFVETRGDAQDIDAVLDATRPALLLLDIGLPGVSGLEVTRRLRADETHAELPIVLVSASIDAATRAAAFAAGADDFQSKPVVPEELVHRITRLLEVGRQRQLGRGVHPGTGIWLPGRTERTFDERLIAAAAVEGPCTVGVMRPRQQPDGVHRAALWHREVRRVTGSLAVGQVMAGFRDETAVQLLFPSSASEAKARLEAFAAEAGTDAIAWCAGLAELRPGGDPSTRQLARLAEEAWISARDRGEHVHRWEATDSGTAPDVIVVEDDAALADLVTFALEARGLTWVRFDTGPEALDSLRAMRVHDRAPLVLLDVDLPGLDGFSLHERLRVERARDFRTVFMSVHASEADQLRALRAGALDYLAKPVSLRVLMAKIVGWRAAATSP